MDHQVIEFLSQPTLGGVGLILTVIFGFTSLVLYEKQKQRKDIWFYVTEVNTPYFFPGGVDSFEEGIEPRIAKEPTANSETRYNVVIWNRGKSTIEGSAISPADPLVLSVGENHLIQSAAILSESRKAVSAATVVDKDKKLATVDFKFLDWKDGMEITLRVTRAGAKRSKGNERVNALLGGFEKQRRTPGVQLSGTVMGVNQIHRLRTIPFSEPVSISILLANVLIALVIGLAFSLSYVLSFQMGILFTGKYAAPALVFFLGAALIWAAIWFWHFRFLPSQNSWFRHEVSNEDARRYWQSRRLLDAKTDTPSP